MKKTLLLLAWVWACLSALAQGTAEPSYRLLKFDDGAIVYQMSDNGKWAVACATNAADAIRMQGARLVDLTTGDVTLLSDGMVSSLITSIAAYDVTNDGQIVGGELNNEPAYYNKATGEWTILPLNGSADMGEIKSITPDGRWAVGAFYYSDPSRAYDVEPALWDLTTGELLSPEGLPVLDMSHQDQKQNQFCAISANGRYILGCLSVSYLPNGDNPGGITYYIYDTETETYRHIGFEEHDSQPWTPRVDGLLYIAQATISNDGRYVTGGAYMAKEQVGSEFPMEYSVPFRYDVESDVMTVFDDAESLDSYGWIADAAGNVFNASPAQSPYRDFNVRSGKYWISAAQIIKQNYGLDLSAKAGITNTGTPMTLSDDGCTIASILGGGESLVLTLPEPFVSVAGKTNLLKNYTVSPKAGSKISKLTTVKLTFDRDVTVAGDPADVIIRDFILGEEIASAVGFEAEGRTVTITFRRGTLDNSADYELVIPARSICLSADATRYNEEIIIDYVGRTEKPLVVVEASPKDGSTVGKLDLSTSPILLAFDTDVLISDPSARGYVYQGENTTPFAELSISFGGNQVMLYPTTTQYLYKDVPYRVELPAGFVTDVTGNVNTANEKITLNYIGAYEREISYEDNVLFSSDCSNGVEDFLVLDNDKRNPSAASLALGFDSNLYGWIPAWDDNVDVQDIAVCSTSMYSPAGRSDDWLVIPSVNIVDKLCKLSFQSQSYRNAATDRLKVYVYESNEMWNGLTSEIVERIRTNGTLIYDEVQSPGAEENMLYGDWKDNVISLEDYAGKNVYIAFLNDNEDESAVFLDNVKVLHELPYYVAVATEDLLVGVTETKISGVVDIREESETFTSATIVLYNGDGEEIDRISENGLSLNRGDKYNFAFNNLLPLTVGEVNDYRIDFLFNETANTINKRIKVLAFTPQKRVVLEEFTGNECPNCPQGHEAIDRLKALYGELFLPIAIHCYTGDPYGNGVTAYPQFLGLGAAPTGVVQRSMEVSSPMYNTNGDYVLRAPEGVDPLWTDLVVAELEKPAEANLSATLSLSGDQSTYTIPVSVSYALNQKNVNHKIFAVVLENRLVNYQVNNLYSVSDPDLGPWGKDGEYGVSMVKPFTFDHVLRGWEGQSMTGTPGLLPSDVTAGTTYETVLNFPVPETVDKPENTEVVVMLFDGNTDKLINVCLAAGQTSNGIDETQTVRPEGPTVIYNLSGVRMNKPLQALPAGVYIVNGKKVIK